MKYRIKIVTYQNARKEYFAYFKKWYGWTGLNSIGDTGYATDSDCREKALYKIDKHFSGNTTVQTIDFEYINKP
jgi:hypothetical protein